MKVKVVVFDRLWGKKVNGEMILLGDFKGQEELDNLIEVAKKLSCVSLRMETHIREIISEYPFLLPFDGSIVDLIEETEMDLGGTKDDKNK